MSEQVATTVAEFAEVLRHLSKLCGRSYRQLVRANEVLRAGDPAEVAKARRAVERHLQELKFIRQLSVLLMQLVQLIVGRLVLPISPRQHLMLVDVAASPRVTRGPSFEPTQADHPWGALTA